MKKIGALVVLGLLAGLFASCVSQAEVDASRRPVNHGEQIIGNVQTTFTTMGPNATSPHTGPAPEIVAINNAAHAALLGAAREEFQGPIDVRDITWVRTGQAPGRHMRTFSGSGVVVLLGGGGAMARPAATGVEGALERAVEDVSRHFTARSRIAIVYVSAEDRGTTEFITGELEHILWRRGFVIVDRSELDRIRAEQQLGLGFEVDDNTAARIGHFAGASVVITGGVDGIGDLRRLRLRALDTATAQVVGTASERM